MMKSVELSLLCLIWTELYQLLFFKLPCNPRADIGDQFVRVTHSCSRLKVSDTKNYGYMSFRYKMSTPFVQVYGFSPSLSNK